MWRRKGRLKGARNLFLDSFGQLQIPITMVNSNQELSTISCICEGFSVFLSFCTSSDTNWFDYFSEIQFDGEDEINRLRSRKTFIEVVDISRLAVYLNQILATGACDTNRPFVPLELGLEIGFFDFEADSAYPENGEGTMWIWINHRYNEGSGRSYMGARGAVTGKELMRFSQQLQNLAKSMSQNHDV